MKREQIKQTALSMVEEVGLINLSRRALCARAGIPDGSFPHVMGCNFSDFIEELSETAKSGTQEVTRARANPKLRRAHILSVAVEQAKFEGYKNITRDGVAAAAGVSVGLVTRYFGTMVKLSRDIMRSAVRNEIPEIIAHGLANGDDHAVKAPAELKAKAIALLSGN